MKRKDLLNILSEFDIKPSKKLGQNFLIDDNLLDFIVRTANIKADDNVIEVGPGLGVLTKKLIETAKKVIAIEFDSRLFKYIQRSIVSDNFTIIEKDALKVDYNELCSGIKNWRLIANLPYSITTPLLANFSEMENPPVDMLFLLQKETADRFGAKPSTKEYGSITIKLQSIYNVKTVRSVSPGVFFPQPEVTSAIVKFTRKESFPDSIKIRNLDKLLHAAFSQRRKKVIKNISSKFPNINFLELFSMFNLDLNTRAEQIDIDTFNKMSEEISRIQSSTR
jgi:16S rRNA (adenine1518-N6/adenine1519-N6)-dimethyltransferase